MTLPSVMAKKTIKPARPHVRFFLCLDTLLSNHVMFLGLASQDFGVIFQVNKSKRILFLLSQGHSTRSFVCQVNPFNWFDLVCFCVVKKRNVKFLRGLGFVLLMFCYIVLSYCLVLLYPASLYKDVPICLKPNNSFDAVLICYCLSTLQTNLGTLKSLVVLFWLSHH